MDRKEKDRRYYERHKEEVYQRNLAWRKKNKKRVSELNAKYAATPKGKKARRLRDKRYSEKNRFKINVRQRAQRAVRSGKIIKGTKCARCGVRNEELQMHHEDYSKVYDISWLCRSCHIYCRVR